jgi:hypothetical protein
MDQRSASSASASGLEADFVAATGSPMASSGAEEPGVGEMSSPRMAAPEELA